MKLLQFLFILVFLSSCANQSVEEKPNQQADNASPNALPYAAVAEGDALAMTAGFENPYYLSGDSRDVFLYVSVVGGQVQTDIPRTPLNISLVVDKSGSMEYEGKLDFVKQACNVVIDNLSQDDNLSLVAYDTEVQTVQKGQKVTNKAMLKQKVNRLRPDGSTNLSGGMLEGYAQVKNLYHPKSVNRVLLLSDGLANQGITELSELQRIVGDKFEKDNIALSTFGVGADFNEDMMTNLAEYGTGNYHFIASPDEIPVIFKKELEGLLSVVAQNTKVKVDFPSNNFEVAQVYGYDYQVNGNQLEVNYNDVFANEEKAVLIRFRKKQNFTENQSFKVELTYDDVLNNYERKNIEMPLLLSVTSDQNLYQSSFNEVVTRNKIMFIANFRFEQATKEADKGNYDKARGLLLENDRYYAENESIIKTDTTLLKQTEVNSKYKKELETIEQRSAEERKMIQKSNKSSNYKFKKKKN